MNIRATAISLIGVLIFAVLLALTFNVRKTADESYDKWLTAIRKVSRAATEMDAAMLISRANRQSDYDELSKLSRDMRETSKTIETLSELETGFFSPVLDLDGKELIDIVDRHNQLVFDFQTELSTLNAATTVFLNSIHEFVKKSGQMDSGILTISLMLIEEKLLITTQEKFEDSKEDLGRRISEIEQNFPEIVQLNTALWNSIVDDAKGILEHTHNLDMIVAEEQMLRDLEQDLITRFFSEVLNARTRSEKSEKIIASLIVFELLIVATFFIFRSRRLSNRVKQHAEQLELLVAERTSKLEGAIKDLKQSSDEKEKLAEDLRVAHRLEAIGQLAAGIAHEINTPTQFVGDNLNFMNESFQDRSKLFYKYKEALNEIAHPELHRHLLDDLKDMEEEIDLEFLEEEMPLAMTNSMDGVKRIAKIVKSMKDFSHPGSEGRQEIDINKALETTLNVAKNEWKYVSKVEKNFDSNLPSTPAYASELNQVLLNIIVNSAHAIEKKQKDSGSDELGLISIETAFTEDYVSIGIRDNGCGIPQENIDRVFDPFFTTKEVGKGTGQGLSIALKIIRDKHKGKLTVNSQMDEYTEFNIFIPRQVNGDQEQNEPSLAKAS